MKRVFIIISILLAISLALPYFVCADSNTSTGETADPHTNQLSSSYIDPSVLDKLDLGPLDKIVKCYSVDYESAFSEYSTFEEVLNSDYLNYIFYVVQSDEEGIKYYNEDGTEAGTPVQVNNTFNTLVLPAYFTESMIKLISPDINVYNVYYLAKLNTDGVAILYYETDMGNYVYYRTQSKRLMPPAVFVDLIRYRKRKHDTMMRGSITTEELSYDLSIYEIYSENFDPHYLPAHLDPNAEPEEAEEAGIHWPSVAKTAAGVAIAIVIGSLIWWKRKRDENYDFW